MAVVASVVLKSFVVVAVLVLTCFVQEAVLMLKRFVVQAAGLQFLSCDSWQASCSQLLSTARPK